MSQRTRRLRGQATVETAVLCIVLVPMLLYAFFLDDLLRYKLDLAEAVFASPWDYTTVNYEDPGDYAQGSGQTSVQHNIRLGLCDHTTAYNSYDGSYECEGKGGNGETSIHHVALSAHECWMVKPDAHQVDCNLINDSVGTEQLGQIFTSGIKDKVKAGGQVSCWGRLAVINYFLPQRVLQSFSQVVTTRTEQKSGDVHELYKNNEVNTQNTYVLERQNMSLVTDTWAMTTIEDVDPAKPSGVLFDRMSPGYFIPLTLPGFMFGMQAMSKQLLSPLAVFADNTRLGDLVLTPQMGFSTGAGPKIDDFYSSAWRDNGSNLTESSYNNRGNHYLGRTNIPK